MGKVDGKKMLHELTIPGSHQTCSYKGEPGTTKTQNRSLLGQLNRGIRFIDIRCRRTKHGFEIVHNKHSLHRHFGKDVVKVCRDFLESRPTETILMLVKEEGDAERGSDTFEAIFESYVNKYKRKDKKPLWYAGTTVPKLNKVRGQIVLFRRFHVPGPYNGPLGIDVTAWKNNATFEIDDADAHLKIQDRYDGPSIAQKEGRVRDLLEEASSSGDDKLYLNFCSAAASWTTWISPAMYARKLNPLVRKYADDHKSSRLGVIVMDFQDATVNRHLIATNFKPARVRAPSPGPGLRIPVPA
jgi:1-phosphatidylinositol phosphodiesterase